MLRTDDGVRTHRVKRSKLRIVHERVVLQRSGFQSENHDMPRHAVRGRDIDQVRLRGLPKRKGDLLVPRQQA